MTDTQDQLTREESDRILHEQIIPDHRLDLATSHERPRAIIVVAAPGAGTAAHSRAVFAELQGDVIRIEPDELADYHPRVRQFREENPLTWVARTAPDATAWAVRLLVHTVGQRKHLLLDTSFSDGSLLSPTLIRDLQERGYVPEIRTSIAHSLESLVGIDKRFTDSLTREGYARHISKAVHDESYDLLPDRLDAIHAMGRG